jgi:hypothetical protein
MDSDFEFYRRLVLVSWCLVIASQVVSSLIRRNNRACRVNPHARLFL